ncbi:MAG: BolA family protein [Magnetovibrionaceae bacterium]
MSRAQTIADILRDAFAPDHLSVEDESHRHAGHAGAPDAGESHFVVELTCGAFEGKSRVERQRLVYDLLKTEFDSGMHALTLRLAAPSEAGNNAKV